MGDITPIKPGQHPAKVGCGSCVYATYRQLLDTQGAALIGQLQLECRYLPPQIVIAGAQGMGIAFPVVSPNVWCHQYDEGPPQPSDADPPTLYHD